MKNYTITKIEYNAETGNLIERLPYSATFDTKEAAFDDACDRAEAFADEYNDLYADDCEGSFGVNEGCDAYQHGDGVIVEFYTDDDDTYLVAEFLVEEHEVQPKLTKVEIEIMAREVRDFLDTFGMANDGILLYNDKVAHYVANEGKWEVIDDTDPHIYSKYNAYDHIFSMLFDGRLYSVIYCENSYYKGLHNQFMSIFKKRGLYYELGEATTLTCYPIDDNMEVEYTHYERPVERIGLYNRNYAPYVLREIMDFWLRSATAYGDEGSCVIGAGFEFDFEGKPYWMPAQSPYQGSLSWEASEGEVKQRLIDAGCTNVIYHWGNMD